MWQIQNPRRVFNYLYTTSSDIFELVAIIPTSKYESFPSESKTKVETLGNPSFDYKKCTS